MNPVRSYSSWQNVYVTTKTRYLFTYISLLYQPLTMTTDTLAGLRCLSKALNVSSRETFLSSGDVNSMLSN